MKYLVDLKYVWFDRLSKIVFLLLFFLIYGCKKDKIEFPEGTNEYINKWVLDSMKVYYYWNSTLPTKPNFYQEPLNFFSSIKNANDRFSQLINPVVPNSFATTLTAKFGLDIVYVKDNSDSQAVVSLVVPGLQADENGLQRGDVIKSINSVIPDQYNIESLVNNSISNNLMNLQLEGYAETIVLKPPSFVENPVYKYKMITKGGKKIGYIFLNSFEESAVASLFNSFAWLKQEGAEELILDLRYNRGGYVSASAALAVMLAPVNGEDIYVEYRGNNNTKIKRRSFNDELSYLSGAKKMNFSQLASVRLNINRVYILTGEHTASAAELLVNNLKPYLPVFQIGGQTLGKDMASFLIKDVRNPLHVPLWEIYPLVFKLYNTLGNGDYAAGLPADLPVDEMSVRPLKPLGDEGDPLIRVALSSIVGQNGRSSVMPKSIHSKSFDSRNRVDESIGGVLMKP